MGMFDNIQWDYYLPDKDVIGKTFQTKSLDNTLSLYKVDENGKLYVQVEKGMPPVPILIMHPCESEWVPFYVTVVVNFYMFGGNDDWIEYAAHIEYGQVIWVVRYENEW